MFHQLCLSVPSPAVFGPSSLPLPLGVPSQGLACDGSWWFTQGVANPTPLASPDLALYWLLAPSLPQLLIADFVRPPDSEDASQSTVDKCLDLLQRLYCHSPCL